MKKNSNEVQFYLDRSKESLITILKSVLENPRLSRDEVYQYLHRLTTHHAEVAQFLCDRLASGHAKGIELANQHNADMHRAHL